MRPEVGSILQSHVNLFVETWGKHLVQACILQYTLLCCVFELPVLKLQPQQLISKSIVVRHNPLSPPLSAC